MVRQVYPDSSFKSDGLQRPWRNLLARHIKRHYNTRWFKIVVPGLLERRFRDVWRWEPIFSSFAFSPNHMGME